MSRFMIVACLFAAAVGALMGSPQNLDHVKEMLTRSFVAQAQIAAENGSRLECGPLASIVPGIRERQIDAQANGEKSACDR